MTDNIRLTAFEDIHPRIVHSPINYTQQQNNNQIILKCLCITPIIIIFLLLLISSIYTNVILQILLLEVNNKLD